MAILNWNAFKYKYNGKETIAFEALAYELFCFGHDQSKGIFRYKNQTGIETEPIMVNDELIGFQAKYYETKIADNKKDIMDSLEKAKNKNPNINKIFLYLNQEFSESKDNGVKNPKYKTEIENFAVKLDINIVWQVPSNLEIILSKTICKEMREYYFPELFEGSNFQDGHENCKVTTLISKESYRELAAYPLFELPVHYIPRSFTPLKIKETKKYYYPDIEYRPLNSLLYENQKIVLLGDAGIGKSTELKRLYNELLKSEQNVFPVWISLNNYTFDDSLCNFIVTLDGIPYENILLIMDGFDEMLSSDMPKLNRQIGNVLSKFKNIQILISSRKKTFDIDSPNSNSSLPDFEIYYLNELSLIEIENYFETYVSIATFNEFIQELERVKFSEIIKNPFYLNIVIEIYLLENKLPNSRSELMNKCINSMILFDDKRNKKIIHIDSYEIRRVIEKVALSMEIFGRNTIIDDNLRMLLGSNEYNILKYFGGFKKEMGKNDVWKFDHNNFQEYLAAKTISHCCFDDILKCISFEPAYDMLNPFWLNTIGYLLEEIKDESTYQLLLSWLLQYNKHFLVGAEPKRIDSEIRLSVFKEIFNEYEKDDQFLYSNQFSDEKLAVFANNHEEVFDFLIDKFKT